MCEYMYIFVLHTRLYYTGVGWVGLHKVINTLRRILPALLYVHTNGTLLTHNELARSHITTHISVHMHNMRTLNMRQQNISESWRTLDSAYGAAMMPVGVSPASQPHRDAA